MNVFKDDLLKNKFFVTILAIVAIIIGVAYVIDYNSVESKCQRYVDSFSSTLGSNNKTKVLLVKTAAKPLLQECIERGGPNSK